MGARILLPLLCAALAGCGLVPPAVSVASFAADAFSYAVSGKSVSDHGLSMVMQEDCAILNFARGDAICAPGSHPDIRMAAPRDADHRTLLASAAVESDAIEDDLEGRRWTPATNDALPVRYLVAGPLVEASAMVPVALTLEPLASGPIDILATVGGEPAA